MFSLSPGYRLVHATRDSEERSQEEETSLRLTAHHRGAANCDGKEFLGVRRERFAAKNIIPDSQQGSPGKGSGERDKKTRVESIHSRDELL